MGKRDKSFFFTEGSEELSSVLEKMVEIAKPDNAFVKPVQSGKYVVIGATEVMASMGVGFGGGGEYPGENGKVMSSRGSGGGGGGVSYSKPIASIVISPDGVSIKPIMDFTKIIIAAIATIGSMAIFMVKVIRKTRQQY